MSAILSAVTAFPAYSGTLTLLFLPPRKVTVVVPSSAAPVAAAVTDAARRRRPPTADDTRLPGGITTAAGADTTATADADVAAADATRPLPSAVEKTRIPAVTAFPPVGKPLCFIVAEVQVEA